MDKFKHSFWFSSKWNWRYSTVCWNKHHQCTDFDNRNGNTYVWFNRNCLWFSKRKWCIKPFCSNWNSIYRSKFCQFWNTNWFSRKLWDRIMSLNNIFFSGFRFGIRSNISYYISNRRGVRNNNMFRSEVFSCCFNVRTCVFRSFENVYLNGKSFTYCNKRANSSDLFWFIIYSDSNQWWREYGSK